MVRSYDVSRPAPAEVVDKIVSNGLRAPSAGFSQGWERGRPAADRRGVPARFSPVGAISIGYSDEPPRDLSSRRRPEAETVHRGRWTQAGE
jgi:nitroreductase